MAVVTWIETEADALILKGAKQANTAEHDVPPVVLLTGHSLIAPRGSQPLQRALG